MLIIDFETRSRCDLINRGAYNYAADRSTTLLCCAFVELHGTREFLWTPQKNLPRWVIDLLETSKYIAAHNAQFDRLIWDEVAVSKFGFPAVPFQKWYCTSAQCRVNGLPASLDDACRALDTKHKKDPRGSYLIRRLSIPQSDGRFCDDPELLKEMGEYCLQDARTTRALVLATRQMTWREHEDWLISEDINDAGILVDLDLARAAQIYAMKECDEIDSLLMENTAGVVTKRTQTQRVCKWVVDQLGIGHPALEYMAEVKDGVIKYSLDKHARAALLEADEANEFHLSTPVYNVITLLEEASQSSVSKFKAMESRADLDHRVRGAFIYAGAAQTQRFSSRGLQLHNLPQRGGFKSYDETEEAYKRIITGESLPGAVMPTLKNLLRHAIKAAPGKTLVIGDWSGIEARILPWLSDSRGGAAKLELIASGEDVYQLTAERIGIPSRRDVGKVMELSCGYQGALGAFKQFAAGYGIEPMPDEEILNLIWQWRDLNSWAVEFWRGLESAARHAITRPGSLAVCGRLSFIYNANLMNGSLFMCLPDQSTTLTYPQCRIDDNGEITALKASQRMSYGAKHWPREQLYGGKLAGHGTQGTAAALLRYLLRLDSTSECIAHVHDEVILEVVESEAEDSRKQLKAAMCKAPTWAAGLPLKAEPFISPRFRK